MKIKKVEIKNFRSLENVIFYPKSLQAFVGKNNSGKSSVMKAIQVLFEGNSTLISDDCFFDNNTNLTIEIFATFNDLSDWEKEQFSGYFFDNMLTVGRKITSNQGVISITTVGLKKKPEQDWLQIEKINTDSVNEWWEQKENLSVAGNTIGSLLEGSRKGVAVWKAAAERFITENYGNITFIESFEENPKGYSGVLKGALPEFIYVPAVRDISEEAKVGKTNPFGQLIGSIMEKITDIQTSDLESKISQIEMVLNRTGGDERIDEIKRIETRLNELVGQIMPCDVEIEMSMPKLREVVSGAKIYVNDGVRTAINAKGHGLQRSMIFSILRAYAEFSHIKKAQERSGQRNTIFAIEEPELYLHPQSQRTLFKVLRQIANGSDQVMYNTHSSLFVDVAYFDEICIMKKIEREEKQISCAMQLSIKQLIDDLKIRQNVDASEEGIREQYSNIFNPMINEGFFAEKIVIVEGNSEEYLLPIYSEILGFDLDQNNVAIVHSNGKGPIDRLIRIFNGFELPTFVWFDGDKNNSNRDIKKKTLELLELLGHSLGNISELNTMVESNFAVLEETLEETLKDEISNYDEMREEAGANLGSCGKSLKHRYMARKIQQLVNSGELVESDSVPQTIKDIIFKLKNLQYGGSILKSY